MDQLFVKSATISAEIAGSGHFKIIDFPNSDIAKRFQCGRTKAGYVAHFRLAPYFDEMTL